MEVEIVALCLLVGLIAVCIMVYMLRPIPPEECCIVCKAPINIKEASKQKRAFVKQLMKSCRDEFYYYAAKEDYRYPNA